MSTILTLHHFLFLSFLQFLLQCFYLFHLPFLTISYHYNLGVLLKHYIPFSSSLYKFNERKNISSKYKIFYGAGLNPSLLTDLFRIRTLYPRIDTLYSVCEGMIITLEEFFKDPMFNKNKRFQRLK